MKHLTSPLCGNFLSFLFVKTTDSAWEHHNSEHQRVEDIAVRAPAYDIPAITIDGNDVLKVYAAADEAVKRAREGGGPTLLNCDTYRFRGHHIGDPGTSYRDREEVQEQERQRDPIRRLVPGSH